MMGTIFSLLIIIVLFIYPKNFKIILQLSFVLIILIISLLCYHKWEVYKKIQDSNAVISCHPEWCETWLYPERLDYRGL